MQNAPSVWQSASVEAFAWSTFGASGATFFAVLLYVMLGALSLALVWVGIAIVGAGVRVSTAILSIAGLLEAIRDRRP